MDRYVTLILLFFGFSLSSCSRFPERKYYYVNLQMTWAEAQHYCREKYTDLATIESHDDISRLHSPFSAAWTWIGMSDIPKSWKDSMGNDSNSWRWSATGETSQTGFQNWETGEPSSEKADENCVRMLPNGKWADQLCESVSFSFICYTETNQTERTYVFVLVKKTWYNARDYCREHYTDLAMIENDKENNEVISTKPGSDTAWIGLYRVRWAWSDKSQSSFKFWHLDSPNNAGGSQYCIAENVLHEWDDDPCDVKLPFICHQVAKLRTTVRMKFKTDADITDPATNTQLLQKLAAALKTQGWTDFKLAWKILPRKQEKPTEPQCNLNVP